MLQAKIDSSTGRAGAGAAAPGQAGQRPSSYLFTSESVTEGHPDKVCDQVSDAILDAILEKEAALAALGYIAPSGEPADPASARVACEVLATTGVVVLAGEIRSQAYIDIEALTREVINDIGYNRPELGFDALSCGIMNSIHGQSPDIARGVDQSAESKAGLCGGSSRGAGAGAGGAGAGSGSRGAGGAGAGSAGSGNRGGDADGQASGTPAQAGAGSCGIGAGDQGMMFGFACDETPTLMPMPIFLAHRLSERLAAVRKDDTLPYLRPDGKTQVGVRYEDGQPVSVEKVLISTQHAESLANMGQLAADLKARVIAPVLDELGISYKNADIYINPTGRFVVGGPAGDTGLTGRKIIVDTYGGRGRHGGGSFSGKDATKVDRSASYAARWVAKNIVAAGLARQCELQVAYAIGMAEPFSVMVDSFGSAVVPDQVLTQAVLEVFDLRPGAIIETLDLQRPIFRKTANYGHFGRELPEFTWERRDQAEALRAAVDRLA